MLCGYIFETMTALHLLILFPFVIQTESMTEQHSCSDDNSSCLTQTLPPTINQERSIINPKHSSTTIQPGTILVAPSGLRIELVERIGLLAENSPECLLSTSMPSKEIVLRPVEVIPKQGLLLPPTTSKAIVGETTKVSTRKDTLRIAPPTTYFTGLDITVLNPTPLSTRREETDSKFTFSKHSYYNYQQYDKGSCGEVWKAKKMKKERNANEKGGGEEEEEEEEEEYILKRIFVHRGENVWLSGWREILFGRLLKGLPNVARFVEYFEVGSNEKSKKDTKEEQIFTDLWLVFKDEGESLRHFLYSQNGPIIETSKEWSKMKSNGDDTYTVIRDIMYNVLNGLKQIHERGVTHRDIKPSNIVVRRSRSPTSRPMLKLVDFGSAMYSHKRRNNDNDNDDSNKREESFKSSTFFENMYGLDGPTTYDMTEKYMPLDLRIQTLLLKVSNGKNSRDDAFVPVVSDEMTTSIDMWSTGIVLLEMILGTDTPFQMNGKKRLKIKRRILKGYDQKIDTIPIEHLIDAVVLIEAAKEYCILPSRPSSSTVNNSSNSTGTMLQAWLDDIETAIRGNVGKGEKGSNDHDKKMWWDQIEPYLLRSEAEAGDQEECDENSLLNTLERHDPLHLGLSLIKEYEAKELIQLLQGLLHWNPQKRVTASEALSYPIFQGMTNEIVAK